MLQPENLSQKPLLKNPGFKVAERDETYLFWYPVPDVDGVRQADFYQNLQRVYSGSVLVER